MGRHRIHVTVQVLRQLLASLGTRIRYATLGSSPSAGSEPDQRQPADPESETIEQLSYKIDSQASSITITR